MEPASPGFLSTLPNGLSALGGLNGITSLLGLGGGVGTGTGNGEPGKMDMTLLMAAASASATNYLNPLDPFSNPLDPLHNPLSPVNLITSAPDLIPDTAALLDIPELDNSANSNGTGGTAVAKPKLSPTAIEANNREIGSMAQIAVTSGNPQAVIAMAKMAAQSGNPAAARAMAQMATIAEASGMKTIPPSAVMQIMAKTGLGGKVGMEAAIEAAKYGSPEGREAAVQVQKYQANITKQAANVQITKTLANSGLAKLSDSEVQRMSEGKFKTTQEFMSYMQAPDTEVGSGQCAASQHISVPTKTAATAFVPFLTNKIACNKVVHKQQSPNEKVFRLFGLPFLFWIQWIRSLKGLLFTVCPIVITFSPWLAVNG